MSDKIIFREMLAEIVELAETKSNKLTVDEINDFFEKVSLNADQMELVYSYLEANKIVVEGHKQNDNIRMFEASDEDTQVTEENHEDEEYVEKKQVSEEKNIFEEEENQYLKMYLDELGTLTAINEKQKIELYNQAIKGDSFAKSRIIEIYLQEVVEIAKKYVNKGILISDLIQEGNIGLMLAIDGIEELSRTDQVEGLLREGVITSIQSVIKENDDIKITKKQIVNKVNYLNEGVTNLEEELGRRVSIAELAKYMEMSEEEVTDIIRVSDDEIIVKENEEKNSNR